jgi:hypothetical protein
MVGARGASKWRARTVGSGRRSVGVVASKKALRLWWMEEGTGCEEFMVDSDVVLLLWC